MNINFTLETVKQSQSIIIIKKTIGDKLLIFEC